MSATPELLRNVGPSYGFAVLSRLQQLLPGWFLRIFWMGLTWIGVARLRIQRHSSRDFLSIVYGRRATTMDVWRHFRSYLAFQLLRLRLANGAPARGSLAPENAADFESLMQSGEPALFGTFHFGHSDLLGFMLATRGRQVAMVRLRVGNSTDTEMLERHFGGRVSFIWVNEPQDLIFAMKSALERGDSLAMQCDRLFSSRAEPFHFRGAERMFPFAIYHLAILFGRPVAFCLGLPDESDGTRSIALPLFRPDSALTAKENLIHGRTHFQGVLQRLEVAVRQHPTQWFNFTALNPTVPSPPERWRNSGTLACPSSLATPSAT